MILQHKYFPVKLAKNKYFQQHLSTAAPAQYGSLVLQLVDCRNTKSRNPNFTVFSLPRNKKVAKLWKNRMKRTDLLKVIALSKEHLRKFCFNKSANLRRRLINRKDKFIFSLVFDLQYIVATFSLFLCLLSEVVRYLLQRKRLTEVN